MRKCAHRRRRTVGLASLSASESDAVHSVVRWSRSALLYRRETREADCHLRRQGSRQLDWSVRPSSLQSRNRGRSGRRTTRYSLSVAIPRKSLGLLIHYSCSVPGNASPVLETQQKYHCRQDTRPARRYRQGCSDREDRLCGPCPEP